MGRIIRLALYAFSLYFIYTWTLQEPSPGLSFSLVMGGAIAVFILYQMLEIGSSVFKIIVAAAIVLAVVLYGQGKLPKRKAKEASFKDWINDRKPDRATIEKDLTGAGFSPKSPTAKTIADFLSKK